jgi:hypothetical protein
MNSVIGLDYSFYEGLLEMGLPEGEFKLLAVGVF